MAESEQFEVNGEDWLSILKGAIVNLGGTALLVLGSFLMSISSEGDFDWMVLKIALATNLGTVLVNIARKFLQQPPKTP